MGRKRIRQGKHVHLLLACVILIGIGGCTGMQSLLARPDYWQADQHLAAQNDQAALAQYREIDRLYPQAADEALFWTGVIHASPKSPHRDYRKAEEAFRRVIQEHPGSKYRGPSEGLLALLGDATNRDSQVMNQRKQVEALGKQVEALEKQVEGLQRQIEQMKEIDKSLEEQRRKAAPGS